MDFTYELPQNDTFIKAVKSTITSLPVPLDSIQKLNQFFDVARCELVNTEKFSGCRWNALGLNIEFFIPFDKCEQFGSDHLLKALLLQACKKVLPGSAGFDILDISITPDIYEDKTQDIINEIENEIGNDEILNLTKDLIEKGKQMAKAYITLYALENRLRLFIHTVLVEKIGEDYSSAISTKLRKFIDSRKNEEQLNKWLPLRGDNDLYYLDFSNLSDLIINNWGFFNDKFSSQQWIKVKLDDVYKIRCLIAHNSYITTEDLNLLNLTTKQILKQIA